MNCCTRCQVYWSCETKWFRGEKNEENICCKICDYYKSCLEKEKAKSGQSKKS